MSLGNTYFATTRREPILVGYWRLNDLAASTVAFDAGPFALNAFYDSALALGPGLLQGDAGALSRAFNGTSGQNAQVPDISALRIVADISLEAWVLPLALGMTAPLIEKANSGFTVPNPYALTLLGGAPRLAVGDGATSTAVTTGIPLSLATPSHVVATTFRGAVAIYVNGVVATTGSVVGQAVADGAQPVYLGGGPASLPLNGLLAECAIYAGALSATRVARHFALGRQVLSDQAHMALVDPPVYS